MLGLAELGPYVLVFLIICNLRRFVLHIMRLLNWQKKSINTDKLSHCFAEHTLLGLAAGLEVPCSQLCFTLWATHLLSQAPPVCVSFSCHMVGVCIYSHYAQGVTGLTHQPHHLADVHQQDDIIKEVCKGVEGPLDMDCSHWHDRSIVGIEVHHQALYRPPDSLWACLLCCHRNHLVTH